MEDVIGFELTDTIGKKLYFSSAMELRSFLNTEFQFWLSAWADIQNSEKDVHNYISGGALLERIYSRVETWMADNMREQLHLTEFEDLTSNWLWSGHELTPAFIECNRNFNILGAKGFMDAIKGEIGDDLRAQSYLAGATLGTHWSGIKFEEGAPEAYFSRAIKRLYEKQKIDLDTVNRDVKARTRSLDRSFAKYESRVASTSDLIEKKATGIIESQELKFSEMIIDFKKKSTKANDLLEREQVIRAACALRERKRYERRLKKKLKEFDESYLRVENLYKEKLAFEAPAEYWRKSARAFMWQGIIGAALTALIALFSFDIFSTAFFNWQGGGDVKMGLDNLQGIILFSASASVFAYLFRVVSRFTFSAFHLMRDAQERKQLTYLYLSLSNEAEVDSESRNIVLQALFSRSETGLLANEHGPTMPTIVDTVRAVAPKK